MTVPDSFGFQIVTNRKDFGRLTIHHLTVDTLSASALYRNSLRPECNNHYAVPAGAFSR